MTDLERAQIVVSDFCGYEAGGRWQPLIDAIADALAAARREGAAEMRERAARVLDEDAPWASRAIRALPLTTDSTPDPLPAAKAHPE